MTINAEGLMNRFFLAILFSVVLSSLPQVALSQTANASFKAEVAQLRKQLAEQEKRIARLEALLAAGAKTDTTDTVVSGLASDSWTTPATWRRLRSGMSERQVIAILGPPTSTETIGGSLRTLFYQGNVGRSGYVSGNVKLGEDRVYLINIPVF